MRQRGKSSYGLCSIGASSLYLWCRTSSHNSKRTEFSFIIWPFIWLRISERKCHLHNAVVNTRRRENTPSWFLWMTWPWYVTISRVSDKFSPLTEQHAVQELTKTSMSGIAIDGEVLSYLELAQVSVRCFFKDIVVNCRTCF